MDKKDTSAIHVEHAEVPYGVHDVPHVGAHEDVILPEKAAYANVEAGLPESDDDFAWTWGKAIALVAVWIPFFADILYVSAVGSLLSIINKDLGPDPAYAWIVNTFAVGAATVSPLVGRLSDIFGRRNFMLLGNVMSGLGCILGATGKSINTLIAASAFVGVGAALHSLTWTAFGELVPKRSRGIAAGALETGLAPASAFGALIAYNLAAFHSWRDIYWICFAIHASSFVLIFFYYRPMNQYIKEVGKTTWDQVKSIDWIGFLLFLSGLSLFLVGISFGGSQFPWKSAGTIVPIVLGAGLVVACGLWEAFMPLDYPFFPKVIFKNMRGVPVITVVIFVAGCLYYSTLILWPLQIAVLYTTDPVIAGWYASANGFGGLLTSVASGLIVRRTKKLHWWLQGLVTANAIVAGAQAIVTPTSSVASTALVVLGGAFTSMSTVVGTMIVQLSVPHEYIGVATAVVACARSTGGGVGTTIYETVLRTKLTTNIPLDVAGALIKAGVPYKALPEVIGAIALGEVTSPALASLTPLQLEAGFMGLKWAYAHTLRTVYLVSITFGALSIIAVCFVGNFDHLMTKHVDIVLEEGAHMHSHTDTGEGHFIKREED